MMDEGSSYRDFKLKRKKLSALLPDTQGADTPSDEICTFTPQTLNKPSMLIRHAEDDDSSSGIGTSLEDSVSCKMRESSEGLIDGEDGTGSDFSRTSTVDEALGEYQSKRASPSLVEKCAIKDEVGESYHDGAYTSTDTTNSATQQHVIVKREPQQSDVVVDVTNSAESYTRKLNNIGTDDKLTNIIKKTLQQDFGVSHSTSTCENLTSSKNHHMQVSIANIIPKNNSELQLDKMQHTEIDNKTKAVQSTIAAKRFTEFTNQVQSEGHRDSAEPKQLRPISSIPPEGFIVGPHSQHNLKSYLGFSTLLPSHLPSSPITDMSPVTQQQLHAVIPSHIHHGSNPNTTLHSSQPRSRSWSNGALHLERPASTTSSSVICKTTDPMKMSTANQIAKWIPTPSPLPSTEKGLYIIILYLLRILRYYINYYLRFNSCILCRAPASSTLPKTQRHTPIS